MPVNTTVHIKEGTVSIGIGALCGYKNLTAVTLPNSITDIGWKAFKNCENLTNISFPTTVTHIGYQAFEGTSWYNQQPAGPLYINDILYAYHESDYKHRGKNKVTSIYIKEGIVSISAGTFMGLGNIQSITLPTTIASIGKFSFMRCNSLKYIVCLAPTPPIGGQSLSDIKRLYVPDSAVEAYKNAIKGSAEILPLSEKPNE